MRAGECKGQGRSARREGGRKTRWRERYEGTDGGQGLRARREVREGTQGGRAGRALREGMEGGQGGRTGKEDRESEKGGRAGREGREGVREWIYRKEEREIMDGILRVRVGWW